MGLEDYHQQQIYIFDGNVWTQYRLLTQSRLLSLIFHQQNIVTRWHYHRKVYDGNNPLEMEENYFLILESTVHCGRGCGCGGMHTRIGSRHSRSLDTTNILF